MLTVEQANAFYDILVKHCLASSLSSIREQFVFAQTKQECTEYRFGGALGFGGKFWINCGEVYVSCYPEDRNPKRKAMIEKANAALRELCTSWGKAKDLG